MLKLPDQTSCPAARISRSDLQRLRVFSSGYAIKGSDSFAISARTFFPCQELSLAGKRAGLQGDRSGTFFLFWEKMRDLVAEGRVPRMIVLENVAGAVERQNLKTLCDLFHASGYRVGAVEMDA